MPIRKTGSLPENIDRQVNEIIRAYREIEEKVNRLQNTLDSQIRSNVESIRQHTLNKSNPHFVTAQQIRALPLEFILDSSAVYFHFYQSLVSTRGIEPDGLQGATKTEYGLVSGNNLCATLLPEGGVAVTEGTTNLIPNNRLKFEGWLAYQGASVTVEQGYSIPGITPDGATRIQISGGTSVIKYYFGVGPGNAGTPASYRVWIKNTGNVPVQVYGNGIPVSNIVYPGEIKLCTGSTDAVSGTTIRQIQFRALDVDDSLDFIAYQPQIEEKPFATPFVEGTRPAGRLLYHDLAKHFNQREFTFACWWRPYTEKGISSSVYDRFFQIDNGRITSGNGIWLGRVYNSAGLMFEVPNADGSGSRQYSFYPNSYPANAWHFIAFVLDVPNMKARIHLNDEYQEFPLTEVPAMLDLQRFFLGCAGMSGQLIGTIGQLNGELKNVLLRPYAVSPETVATWYSLDVPFIDPFILPSQRVAQTPDDITIIETPENTEDDITIIETSENTEVV